jgi:hypothetical protein
VTPAGGAAETTAFRLVTRVFLRRLIDNDLISPHADRHESLAVVYALTVSLAVFVTFFISTNYLAAFIQFPGPAALSALSDRFLFIAASMAISALGALMVWEALALETRDAAILGPLPISPRTISRAKLAAAGIFGAALTVALNAVPSVLYPAFLTLNIRGTRGATIARLIAAHATTVTMAGLFGFFGILAIRGTLRLLLGEQAFRRASNAIQSALVVSMIAGLLLAPTVGARDVRRWVSGATIPRWPARPVLWYLGANETLAGHLVAETPLVPPPRFSMVHVRTAGDRAARAEYRDMLPQFAALARRAWLSLPIATALALATFLWTNRRLPDRSAGVPAPSRFRASVRRLAERWTANDPELQAGFFFALQTLTRSAPHRTIIAIAVAIGLTHALLVLTQSGHADALATMPLGLLGVAIMSLATLLAGIRYAAAVPADLAASWTIRMAWLGEERRYLAGVKRAAILLASVQLIVLLPLHVAIFGIALAAVHTVVAFLFAAAAVDALFLSCAKLPFACSYAPIENPKVVWPATFAGLLIVTYGFANAERWALQAPWRTLTAAAALAGFMVLVDRIDRARRRERQHAGFDDRPSLATLRLGLFEHIATHD